MEDSPLYEFTAWETVDINKRQSELYEHFVEPWHSETRLRQFNHELGRIAWELEQREKEKTIDE